MSDLSVKEIKNRLENLGINFDGIFEKSDLITLLDSADRKRPRDTAVAMSVADLKETVRSLAGRPSQCSEKMDLFNLAKELLNGRTCRICLDALLDSPSDVIVRVVCCGTFFHRSCLAEWILNSTQEGIYPHKCPSCPSGKIQDSFVISRVIPQDHSGMYLRYIAAVEALKALRAGGRSCITREEEKQLHAQGFRKCPKCGAWIEKGPSMEAFGITLAEGCDKMTCRCGCKFCFKCGSLNANCNCTGADHGFFDHQEVLDEYPRSQLGPAGLLSSIL
jgi:hypothetical protein